LREEERSEMLSHRMNRHAEEKIGPPAKTLENQQEIQIRIVKATNGIVGKKKLNRE